MFRSTDVKLAETPFCMHTLSGHRLFPAHAFQAHVGSLRVRDLQHDLPLRRRHPGTRAEHASGQAIGKLRFIEVRILN